MADFADNFFIKRKHDTFSRNIAGFFLMTYQFYCKLVYIDMIGLLLKNCGHVTAFLADKAGFVGKIS